jgi:hypoxanthine phosphoribosyltransferase
MDEIRIKDKIFRKMLSRAELNSKIQKVADEINEDYNGKNPIFLVVLKGAMFFAADLLRLIKIDCEIETIKARSYGQKMETSGKVELEGLRADLKGRDIIIIEDIVDSGFTMKAIIAEINSHDPASVNSAVLLSKPEARKTEVPVGYICLSIPPEFVVGYGLDYAEAGRNLPDIYVHGAK